MKLTFIGLGGRLIRYFSQLDSYLRKAGIESEYVSINPKVRSFVRRIGAEVWPKSLFVRQEELNDETILGMINPVIVYRCGNLRIIKKQLGKYYKLLNAYFDARKPNAVFLWNGYGIFESVAAYLCKQRGIKILYGENGYMPNTMQIDPSGINYSASITRRLSTELSAIQVNQESLQELKKRIEILHNGLEWKTPPESQLEPSLLSRLVWETISFSKERILHKYNRSRINRSIPDRLQVKPDKFIFIPFQVEWDSQLIMHSPLVQNDMGRFLEICRDSINRVAPEYRLLVKLHPVAQKKVNYESMKKKFPDVCFVKGGSVREYINDCDAVITVNSTVGFEALTFYKPVVTLGKCLYNVPGVANHVSSLDVMDQVLHAALSNPVDKQQTDTLLYYLYEVYFAHGSWKSFTKESFQNVSAKIIKLIKTGMH